MTEMYKDLLTTAFLRYHGAVATNSPAREPSREPLTNRLERSSSGRKLLGFFDTVLGATGTGLGISNWISTTELQQNELRLKALIGQQVLQTDAYLQEGLSEEKETVQDIHKIASALSIIAQRTKKAFNAMQKQVYCAQFASIKHQEITHILQDVLAGIVPSTLFTEEVIMKWFGLKDCFDLSSDNLKHFMDRLGKCKLPIPYSYIVQMARISSHPLPAGFYSPLDYGPLMEGVHLPFSPRGGEPSKSTNKIPPIQILRWWNETVVGNPNDTSWACSAGNSLKTLGCFMRQMYAMLLTVSIPLFQKENVFEKILSVENLGILQGNVLKEISNLPRFVTQLPSGEWRGLKTELCDKTAFGFVCEQDALEKQQLCGTPQANYESCEINLTHVHDNFIRVIVSDKKTCITTTVSQFSVFVDNNQTVCPVDNTSFCMSPKSTWSIGSYHFPYVNTTQQAMLVKPEEQLGYLEDIPEFDFEIPKLDDLLMSLMQRKDKHIVKAQRGLDEKDKVLTRQMHDGDLLVAYSSWFWDLTFKSAVCVCIFLIVCQCIMIYCMCVMVRRQIADSSVINVGQSRWW